MAVYTSVDVHQLQAFLSNYTLEDVVSYQEIAEGTDNSNFLITTSSTRYVLTLYEQRLAEKDLPFFLGLMKHLAAQGVCCPQPIPGIDKRDWYRLCSRPAALLSFVQGWPAQQITQSHCRQVGLALGTLHQAAADWKSKRDNELSLAGWQSLFGHIEHHNLVHEQPALRSLIQQELGFLEHHWPDGLPSGAIHADLFPDNVFFVDGLLSGVIDFYFACTDFLAYDLAICLNAWCFGSDNELDRTKARALVEAYQSCRALESAEWKYLGVLARGAALRFLLTRLSAQLAPRAGLVRVRDPHEYAHKLRFHQRVVGAQTYGSSSDWS